MAIISQVLDHSGWLANPLRFNIFAYFLCVCERKTAHTSADSHKFALAVWVGRLRLRFRLSKLGRVFAEP